MHGLMPMHDPMSVWLPLDRPRTVEGQSQMDLALKVLFSVTLTVGERLRMLNLDISVTDGLAQDFLTALSFFAF